MCTAFRPGINGIARRDISPGRDLGRHSGDAQGLADLLQMRKRDQFKGEALPGMELPYSPAQYRHAVLLPAAEGAGPECRGSGDEPENTLLSPPRKRPSGRQPNGSFQFKHIIPNRLEFRALAFIYYMNIFYLFAAMAICAFQAIERLATWLKQRANLSLLTFRFSMSLILSKSGLVRWSSREKHHFLDFARE